MSAADAGPPPVEADYFDGASARPRRVRLEGHGGRVQAFDDEGLLALDIDARHIDWPERTRHAARVAHLPDAAGGGSLTALDAAAFDNFARAVRGRDSLIVRAQQSWRATLAAVLALIVVGAAAYVWGLPFAARGIVALVPERVDREIGEAALDGALARWFAPSRLDAARRQRIAERFARAVDAAYPAGTEPARPAYELRFARSRIGPNAIALPGGLIVLTDELVELAGAEEDIVLGVLAHELGHVRLRHGMRSLAQASLLATAGSIALGDFSTVLAGVPALLGQLGYSRDFEREADAEAVHVLRSAGLRPDVMVLFFERIERWRVEKQKSAGQDGEAGAGFEPPIALSSHPADAERIAFFRKASEGGSYNPARP